MLLNGIANLGRHGEQARQVLRDEAEHHSTDIVKAEALSGLRRLVSTGELKADDGSNLTRALQHVHMITYPIEPFIGRIWELRESMSVYDAWYVALAETLNATLVTSDQRLSRSPGIRCPVTVLG